LKKGLGSEELPEQGVLTALIAGKSLRLPPEFPQGQGRAGTSPANSTRRPRR